MKERDMYEPVKQFLLKYERKHDMKGLIICLLSLSLLAGCTNHTNNENTMDGEQALLSYLAQHDYMNEDDIGIVRVYEIGNTYEYYLIEHSEGQYMVRLPAGDQPLKEEDIDVAPWEPVEETPYEREQARRALRRRRSNYYTPTPVIIP